MLRPTGIPHCSPIPCSPLPHHRTGGVGIRRFWRAGGFHQVVNRTFTSKLSNLRRVPKKRRLDALEAPLQQKFFRSRNYFIIFFGAFFAGFFAFFAIYLFLLRFVAQARCAYRCQPPSYIRIRVRTVSVKKIQQF